MSKMIRPACFEGPLDSFVGGEHMRVADIAAAARISVEEVWERLRRENSAAFSDFTPDGQHRKDIAPYGENQPKIPPEFAQGLVPAYAWDQVKKQGA